MLAEVTLRKQRRTLTWSCLVCRSRHTVAHCIRKVSDSCAGKLLEVNPHEKKSHGKYSLEGALLLKTHAALQSLKESNGE
jgi:hypothetical protein